MTTETTNPNLRTRPDFAPLDIDAQALVEELLLAHLPADPPVDEIDNPQLLPVAPCVVCDATEAWTRYSVRGTPFRLVVCPECGLGTLHPKPTPRQIAKFYPPEYYGSPGAKFTPLIERLVRWSAARTGRNLIRDLHAGSRVLDVGCGRGVLLSAMADAGMEAHGFEISPTAAKGADSRAEIRIASSLQQAAYAEGSFDLVILCHVLEHLSQPAETLREIHRILRPGGRLVVTVPNFSSLQAQWTRSAWFHLDLPRHLYHFPAQGLNRLLERTGFRSLSEQHFSLSQNPFGWVQSLLNQWGPRNRLYSHLKRTKTSAKDSHSWGSTLGLAAAYWLGMPIATVVSLLCASVRRGATVTVIAESASQERH